MVAVFRRRVLAWLVMIGILGGSGWYLWTDYQAYRGVEQQHADDSARYTHAGDAPDGRGVYDPALLRRVDFPALQDINGDVASWLSVPHTGIDSVVMQEPTVGQYIYNLRNMYKRYNGAGTFLFPAQPQRDDGSRTQDAHQLLLGHNMAAYNGEWMFSHVPSRWGRESGAHDYPYAYLYYGDHSERWRVWAAARPWPRDMIYDEPYEIGSDHYQELLDHIQEMSLYQVGQVPDRNTRTLVLSTCDTPNGGVLRRFVVVLVPDVFYTYETGSYTDVSDHQKYMAWKTAIETRDQQIREHLLKEQEIRDGTRIVLTQTRKDSANNG